MIDFEKRLTSLKERRQGSRERAIFESMDSMTATNAIHRGFDIREKEAFENLRESAGVKYTIGAMAPVEEKSTQISIDEGNRVAESLIRSLNNLGESVITRLQGSVALDIHIKGHSDVDMLIIVTNPVNVEQPQIVPSLYTEATDPRSLVNIAKDIRYKSEAILPNNFPRVDVDCSGNKSIALSGGSLKRKVDIVPAVWFDSIKYQQSSDESERGIKIYNKKDHELILNFPFTHIKLINERDQRYQGNLKCVIRLMKNMIADMPEGKKQIAKKLSSYDLASIAYDMDMSLSVASYMRLGLVEKIRSHLFTLLAVKVYRENLDVPDKSRKVFDHDSKVKALEVLEKEFSDLALSIYKELNPYSENYDSSVILSKSI
ncbi:hypothetical protein PVK64_19750 [Aliivibrio sp. S4TY2]|uniref:hypothetical protein n=1 Tax=unclassified Aliivibrio TaxID=2645654 RepID=UPI00237888DF|nr:MULTISPECIES: hypothetical protein [unclassified Aliivibrio]MDD9158403.1 hypothetical protein [Aliivibrio sp. S4TY2]MDD9162403.1 hypothetical protein [Aliivibrio sp. S4TY1]MDD9166410.1 hypothetical protein [Aliivibrio sp. S4MY2]MDD9170408.1 hypothetical protein [Aliivibrio sp. S4MY4]MDD9187482.1 hypothetical protein [Aliivibrio sp. S4MY3]